MPVTMIDTDAFRNLLGKGTSSPVAVLDVRQEWEYEQGHIPGARLIPLVELADRMDELDRDAPLYVYCRSGGRSMAASALLEGQGFGRVHNVLGGFMAWQGAYAFGPMELGLAVISGSESPVEVVRKAYAMEHALQVFYQERADMAETLERIELFTQLAGFEDTHKTLLFRLYGKVSGSDVSRDAFERDALAEADGAVEGGAVIQDFLDTFKDAFESEQGILQLAVMIEAQALDFYLRCARRAEDPATTEILERLAAEEKSHLKVLGRYMDGRGD